MLSFLLTTAPRRTAGMLKVPTAGRERGLLPPRTRGRMSKIVVFGPGYLGHRLAAELAGAVLLRTDITDRNAVRAAVREYGPDVVINTAAKTGIPNVDWCETHQTETYRANVIGALNVAEAAGESGAYLLHLASGCVYYGRCPFREDGWHEEDAANPLAFYTRSKYSADLMLSRLPNVGIARLRLPLGGEPHARNLITKLANYTEVVDVENSVTVVDDFIHVARELVAKRAPGVFHVTNPGVMRHRDLLDMYRELVDPSYSCTFITAEELTARGLATKARSNTILGSPRLAEFGIQMRPIEVALRDAMTQYAAAVKR